MISSVSVSITPEGKLQVQAFFQIHNYNSCEFEDHCQGLAFAAQLAGFFNVVLDVDLSVGWKGKFLKGEVSRYIDPSTTQDL